MIKGKKYGRLTVLRKEFEENAASSTKWVCLCDCGKELLVKYASLIGNNTKSCGCLKMDMLIKRSIKHNKSNTPIWTCYKNMRSRCLNPKHKHYNYYGGRGITICARWMEPDGKGFLNFLEDMGDQPTGLELDRIDVNADSQKKTVVGQTAGFKL